MPGGGAERGLPRRGCRCGPPWPSPGRIGGDKEARSPRGAQAKGSVIALLTSRLVGSRKRRTSSAATSGRYKGLADAADENEGDPPARDLLVLGDGAHQAFHVGGRARMWRCRSAGRPRQMGGDAGGVGGGQGRAARKTRMPAPCRWPPPRHASGAAIAGRRLQRVAEGVAEIEERPPAGLVALVGGDDRRLGAAAVAMACFALAPAGEHAAPVSVRARRRTQSPMRPYFTTSA